MNIKILFAINMKGINNMTKEKEWVRIEDKNIVHIWVKDEYDDCENKNIRVEINPDWYQYNGTPLCSCGEDLVYSHTEVLV